MIGRAVARNMATRRLLLGLSAWLAACQPAFIDGRPNEESPYFKVPVQSALVLQQPLDVPPRSDRLYFQAGRALAWYEVNEYAPYCALRLRTMSQHARRIERDRFVVLEVSTRHMYRLARVAASAERAGASRLHRVAQSGRDDGGGDTYEVVATDMALASARQPEVAGLICAAWGLPQQSSHLTVRRIRQALGPFFELALATARR